MIEYLSLRRFLKAIELKKLNVFILKSYLGPFVMTFFIALFILLLQYVWKYIDDLVGKGLDFSVIAQLLFYATASMVPLALPLAILLSSLMTFGNFGEHYELVAMKSAGISLQKTMRPLVVTAIVISVSAFFFSNFLLPVANLKMCSIMFDVKEKKPAISIKEGVFYNGIDDFVIKVGSKDNDGQTIHNVMIYDHTNHHGNTNLTIAETGKMVLTSDKRYLIFTLSNGCNYDETIDDRRKMTTRPMVRTNFKEEYRRFDLSAFQFNKTNEEFFKDNYQMMDISQLQLSVDSQKIEMHKRQSDFSKSFIGNFYFFSHIDTNQYTKPDTMKPLTGDLMANVPKNEKLMAIESALNMARSIKERIEFTREGNAQNEKYLIKYEIEWHRKFTLSIACLLLFFIGAPLGAIIRKGGLGLPVVVSVIFFIIFHVISITGEKFVREGVLPAWQGMWIAAVVFLPLGIFLTIKATTDSKLFDSDSYLKGFERLYKWKKRKKKA